jgi:hypothetical protein
MFSKEMKLVKSIKIVLLGALILSVFLTASIGMAGELRPLNIFINQKMIDMDVPVVYNNYQPYVPLRFICEALKVHISYDPAVKAVFVDGKMLEQPYVYYGRDVYLSVERVEELLALKVGLDAEYEMIAIYTPSYKYVEPEPYWKQKATREVPTVEASGTQPGTTQPLPTVQAPGTLPGGVPPAVPPPLFP